MAIPKIDKHSIIDAIKYIDENGVPDRNKSTQYVLVMEDGKQYPLKYVIAVADHLANGTAISTDGYNTIEAKNYFETRGYTIEVKQEKFELTITASQITSTDERFDVGNLNLGDNYKPIDVYFAPMQGDRVRRKYNKGERRNTNQTLPRLAFQIFEEQIAALSEWDRDKFPICQYRTDEKVIRGIYLSLDEYKKKQGNSIEYLMYSRENGPQFLIYCWNVFSTLVFVQECLKRFGNEGDQFVLTYRDKTDQEKKQASDEAAIAEEEQKTAEGCKNPYSKILIESKNVIFRGAPGTGKSFLAKEIAADIISDGYTDKYTDLSDEQKRQVEFVQFHPSYDYSDFVEGLRPKMNEDGSMGFELQDGIFKKFIDKARKNFEDSKKSKELVQQEISVQAAMTDFFESIDIEEKEFKTTKGSKFRILNVDENIINIEIPNNAINNIVKLKISELQRLLEREEVIEKSGDIKHFFGKQVTRQEDSYYFVLYQEIMKYKSTEKSITISSHELKKYIFIIDEINRGEISKILGELFFSIDPGYRGKSGEVSTQYSNMHANPNEKFYIPENVYIIGTMNDIDRSVDSFDFAMRRRFRFVEVRAEDTQDMLELLENEELKKEAILRMNKLNAAIIKVPDLNENYQIGAAYFLKLKSINFDELWTDYLQPLLREYVRGMYDEEEYMKVFARAYGYKFENEEDTNEGTQN